jgi:hypothetical protein
LGERVPRSVHPKIMRDSDSKKRAQTPSQAERVDRYQVCSTRETPSLPWNAEKRIMQPNIWKDKASREEKSEMNKATRGRMRGMKSSSLKVPNRVMTKITTSLC